MAKVQGPLMSMNASGTFAQTLTFSKWKGRAYVRNRVDPSNPKTLAQADVRNPMRNAGSAVHWANVTAMMQTGAADLDKDLLRNAAPSGQAWNGFLVKMMIGPAQAYSIADTAAYTALTAPQKAAWDTAAAALDPPMSGAASMGADDVPGPATSAGFVFYAYSAALNRAAALFAPFVPAVPTAYA